MRLGEQFKKPVVATCDVHFLNPEDEIYRRIIMAGKGFKDARRSSRRCICGPPRKCCAEFDYSAEADKAEEVVITNTNRIADMCERIAPVRARQVSAGH